MKLQITDEALKWFRNELDLEPGDKVNFYVQAYVHTLVYMNILQLHSRLNRMTKTHLYQLQSTASHSISTILMNGSSKD